MQHQGETGRRLSRGLRGAAWVAAILVVFGLALASVAVWFWSFHPLVWETALAWSLFAAAAFTALGVLFHHKALWGSVTLILIIAAAIVAGGHYAGWF